MKENIEKSDIVVVGGGPCGSFAALNTVKPNVKVVVFEEHGKVGVPKHCAGLISIKGLETLGLQPPPKSIENKVCGAVFYSPSGESFSVRRDLPVSYVIDRTLFDQYIAKLAMSRQVEYVFETAVKSLLLSSGRVHGVSFKKQGGLDTLTSKIVIDAEGCTSRLLKNASLPMLDSSMLFFGVQAEVEGVEGVDEEMVEIYLGQGFAPGFFAWIIPKGNGLAKVGLASKFGNPWENLKKFMEKHPAASKKLRRSKIDRVAFHLLTLGGPTRKTYGAGLLIVGDAASHVKPTTGGGVIFGMLGAKIAGKIACEALQHNDFSEQLLSRYQSKCRKLMGMDMRIMSMIRSSLMRMPDSKLDKLIMACKELELQRIIEEKGDMDFQGKTLIRVAKNPRAMMLLLSFASSFLASSVARRKI